MSICAILPLSLRRSALAVQMVDLGRAQEETEARLAAGTSDLEGVRAALSDAERRAGELRLETVALADEVDRGVSQLTTLKVAATQATVCRRTSAADAISTIGGRICR